MSVYKIAIVGGPGGGKSTVLKMVEESFGDRVLVMPEVASLLYNNGYPRAEESISEADLKLWRASFQEAIFFLQKNMEEEYVRRALRLRIKVLIYDRGILDGAAYCANGLAGFIENYGLSLKEAYERYDQVIHFESLAVSDPKRYEFLMETNPARFEKSRQAVRSDKVVKEIWSGHPNRVIVQGLLGIDGLTEYINNLIGQKLSLNKVCDVLISDFEPGAVIPN